MAEALLARGYDGKAEAAALFVPGRIEVLGKHTDYAGGRSLVAATERGFSLVTLPRGDARFVLLDAGRRCSHDFEIRADEEAGRGWTRYPAAVIRRLVRNFPSPELRGADAAIFSSLPAAAGMSSSSALVVAVYLALARRNTLAERPEHRAAIRSAEDLAGYLGTIENGQSFGTLTGEAGVGTFGGSEDHTAILCSRRSELRQYRYCPVRFERAIPVPRGHLFAVAASGVQASKTGGARESYNRVSLLAREAAEVYRRGTGGEPAHLAAILERDGLARVREVLRRAGPLRFTTADLVARVEHFHAESEEILPAAGDALTRGDLDEWGRWVDRSQELAERLLGNQIPETTFLARSARELGAVAASAFGAGFGGSVWALVAGERAEELLAAWKGRYLERYRDRAAQATFFLTSAGAGATEIT